MKKSSIFWVAIIAIVIFSVAWVSVRANSSELLSTLINSGSNNYVQLHEYSSDLQVALAEKEKDKKLEYALVALSKATDAREGIEFLGPIFQSEGIDSTFLRDRINMMVINTRHYIMEIGNHGDSISEDLTKKLKKDMQDAQFITKTLNHEWILQKDFEKVKNAILTLSKEIG
ncbi:hypothetical protein [Brevibacillus sp. H7]|uniref:hypothetical protein n=1 Tax=Brevibacillus sp. H7 TaxID=3349138 RepID=UPI003804DB09